jgi:hypothetical protein
MIDRKARDGMAKALRSYMNEETTAFQFDQALDEATTKTEDGTAKTIGRVLWFHYDDFKDHTIVAAKEEWDFFNRVLLLLESDGELETVNSRREWHGSQAVAAGLLIAFLAVAVRVGFGEHLFAYALPFGPPSMLIAWWNARRRRKTDRSLDAVLTPFPSVGSLMAVRRQVAGFARRRYPPNLSGRRIREPFIGFVMGLPSWIGWCMLSPIPLFFQMLPERESETRIRMPGQDAKSL